MAQKKSERVIYDVKNIETLKSLIFMIDGYRVHHYEEIAWVDRVVDRGDMGWRFRTVWDELRKALIDMATVPKSLLHLLKWADVQAYLKLIGLVMSTVMIVLVGVSLFFFWGRQPGNLALTTTLLSYLAAPLIVLLVVSFAGPPLIARKIYGELDRYREAHPEKFTRYAPYLKETVQTLIDSLVDAVKKGKVEPAVSSSRRDLLEEASDVYEDLFNRILHRRKKKELKHFFNLFNIDYAGIVISKKPSRFRRFYLVEPKL